MVSLSQLNYLQFHIVQPKYKARVYTVITVIKLALNNIKTKLLLRTGTIHHLAETQTKLSTSCLSTLHGINSEGGEGGGLRWRARGCRKVTASVLPRDTDQGRDSHIQAPCTAEGCRPHSEEVSKPRKEKAGLKRKASRNREVLHPER